MKNIYGVTLNELENYFIEKKEGKFKATQVFEWIYKKRVKSFGQMKNVSKKTMADLENDFSLDLLKLSISFCKSR